MTEEYGKARTLPTAAGACLDTGLDQGGEPRVSFRDVFDNLATATLLLEPDDTISLVNDACLELSGHAREEVEGVKRWQDFVHPDCLPWMTRMRRQRLLGVQVRPEFETRLVRRDSAVVDVFVRVAVLDGGRSLVSILDFSRRKAAERALKDNEARFRTLVDMFAHAVVVVQDGRFVFAGGASAEVFGLDAAQDLVGVSTDRVLPGHERHRVGELHRQWLRQKDSGPGCYECDLYRVNGRKFPAEVCLNTITFEGRPAWQYIVSDITRRRARENHLAMLYEVASAVNAAGDVEELCRRLHRCLSEFMDAANFFVALHDPATGGFRLPYVCDQRMPGEEAREKLGNPGLRSLTARVLSTCRPALFTGEELEQARARGEVDGVGPPAAVWLGVPLKTGNRAIGVMGVQDYEDPDHFGPESVELLAAISEQTALAIESQRGREALAESEAQFRTLAESTLSYIAIVQDRTVRYLNPAGERLLGMNAGDLTPEMVAGLFREPYREIALGEVLESGGRGLPTRGVTSLSLPGGMTRWVDLSAVTIDYAGRPAVLMTGMDVTERRLSEQETARAEAKYRTIFENAPVGIFQTDASGRYLSLNPRLASIFGFSSVAEMQDEVLTLQERFLTPPRAVVRALRRLAAGGRVEDFETLALRRDGQVFWIQASGRALFDEAGNITGYEGFVSDITERKLYQEELKAQKTYFQQLFESSPQAVVIVDEGDAISDVNAVFTRVFGYTAHEAKGRTIQELIVPPHLVGESHQLVDRVLDGEHIHKETTRRRKDGSTIHVAIHGCPIQILGSHNGAYYIYNDITEQKSAEEQLIFQAFHDHLTGLPNRALFMDRLSRAMQRSRQRSGYLFAVLYLDIDRFKVVNDSLGHTQGDQIIRAVGTMVRECVRGVDTVSRIGGDEFAVLLDDIATGREAVEVAKKIQSQVRRGLDLGDNRVHVTASIGIVLGNHAYDQPEFLLRDADIAMYRAKQMGKDRFKFFHSRMREAAVDIMRLETDMRRGLKKREFEVFYQPIVAAASHRLTGFEALVRWRHPQRGLMSPREFIPLAEEAGLIIPLGTMVLDAACRQLKAWQKFGPESQGLWVSVNLSARQFIQPGLVDGVAAILERRGLAASHLKLEITETVLMGNSQASRFMLERLKRLGVSLSMDDFGTGYSSLAYLHQFPIDTLKVDRSFIAKMSRGGGHLEIVRAIMKMAQHLGLAVVAEGVETPDQARVLAEMGCDYFQGHHFWPALEAARARELVTTGAPGGPSAGGGTDYLDKR
jgi:Amt family ammonium transporter